MRSAAEIQAKFRNDVDELIYKSLESAKGRARIILADTLRSEERVAYQDAITNEKEREAVRRHPW